MWKWKSYPTFYTESMKPDDRSKSDQLMELFIEQIAQKEYYKKEYFKQREEIDKLKKKIEEMSNEKV